MSVIKQISVYDGSTWGTKDIGADAGNILLSSNIAGSTNLQTALGNILPASQLTANQVLIADSNKKLATNGVSADFLAGLANAGVSSTQFSYLDGVTSGIQTQINTINSNLDYMTYSQIITDFNQAINPAYNYYGTGSTTHTPYNVNGRSETWWFCKVIAKSGNMLIQLSTPMNTTSSPLFMRSSDTNGTWGTWNYIGGAQPAIRTYSVSLGSITVSSNAVAEKTVSVASNIPNYYQLIGVIPRTTGSYAFYFYNCRLEGTTSVYVQLYRITGSATTVSPTVDIIVRHK